MRLTSEARRVLAREGLSRREFLNRSGLLIVSFSAIDCNVRLSEIYERVNLPSGGPELVADDLATTGDSGTDG